ncbi:MAG: 5'/3'-nucleotidase SurE [Actinomycetota bacterium]|nr:5'/3'-nucleotidase SurE [Acidimicrobiia bacterium]MDQ3145944.1 5'/3'-nucleotidase SurE [Actinomycetota bacterium]
MRILVTNDDGIGAPGIVPLAEAVVSAGHDVVVAAPRIDMSGSSAAIGVMHADETIDVEPVELDGLPGVTCYGVEGPPALAVLAARLGGFGEPPEIVVSGINPGPNTGRAVLHSGTVGAALTAANFGISGLAVSLAVGEPNQWATAASLAGSALAWLLRQPPRTVLNLNVPDRELSAVRGVRRASLAPFGTVRAALVESEGGGLQMELAEHGEELPADSDTALVLAGYAAVTSLVGIRAAEGSDAAESLEQSLLKRSA